MTILTDASLEFAKEHINKFYDTDFFPKPYEFHAIWFCWDDVKKELLSKNIEKMQFAPPRAYPWKKPKNGYRIVHQLEPIDAIIYTALAHDVANKIETARVPEEFGVACAYRISISDGSFFSSGSGYDQFREFSKSIASRKEYVLLTDIADFYNQLYLHRVNNAIEHADYNLKNIADDIETFLTRLNDKVSQGIPVGPAASIIMAEAALTDVDQFLIDLGVEHTRYVDDFRIFSGDKSTLESVLQKLTLYLYKNHRLTLSSEKTMILSSKEFIEKLENPYEIEKIQAIEEIEVLDPYNNEIVDIFYVEDEVQTHQLVVQKITEAFDSMVKKAPLDLGYTRALLRQARSRKVVEIIPIITKNFDFFLPVANNIILFLNEVTNEQTLPELVNFFSALTESDIIQNELPRIWIEWYLTKHVTFLRNRKIGDFLYSSPNMASQARAAVLLNNLSWIRNKRSEILTSGSWQRRAILYASQILPTDERTPLLKQVLKDSPYFLDKCIVNWLMNKDRIIEYEIPF